MHMLECEHNVLCPRLAGVAQILIPYLLVIYAGMHYPESRFYVRRVRLSSDADVLGPLRDAGYRFGPTSWLLPPLLRVTPFALLVTRSLR